MSCMRTRLGAILFYPKLALVSVKKYNPTQVETTPFSKSESMLVREIFAKAIVRSVTKLWLESRFNDVSNQSILLISLLRELKSLTV